MHITQDIMYDKEYKGVTCGKNVIYCHFFDKITRIPSGRIVVPSGRIAVPLMGGFLVLEGKCAAKVYVTNEKSWII